MNLYKIAILIALAVIAGISALTLGCKKEGSFRITTLPVSEITGNSAKSGGAVTYYGEVSVTSRGLVWSTSENPTVEVNDGSTSESAGEGEFFGILTELVSGTDYYVRAYAINDEGVSYGNVVKFTTKELGNASLTTSEITEITSTSAISGGNIIDDGWSDIVARGVVWSASENPTTESNDGMTNDGEGEGGFISNLDGLSPTTTYYVRAYAINTIGTSYGNELEFSTVDKPSVTTSEITGITVSNANTGGNVISDGGSYVLACGIVWNTTANPTLEDNIGWTINGEDTGEFEGMVSGLSPETTYFVRAYATSTGGTGYGEQKIFTTNPGISDIEGNGYNTVVIGIQEWFAENLRVSRYADGTEIPQVTEVQEWRSLDNGAFTIFPYTRFLDLDINSDPEMLGIYGALYNWYAVDNPSGLCPAGWRVPDDDDWTILMNYITSTSELITMTNIGQVLKSCRQVGSPRGGKCDTDAHPRWNWDDTYYGTNDFGFSALPAGVREIPPIGLGYDFEDIGLVGGWWSSTEQSFHLGKVHYLNSSINRIILRKEVKGYGLSVRCIRDVE